ncbi:hypothetical protein Taro_000385 [Colocasia esculenta]|uniref:Uncharacterized protein n=1 Tax=Colocasia esculenta TaxID=4460 RepID=A0A843TC43_COLES|nr:hypothetical protein [Colocasia esculenta]
MKNSWKNSSSFTFRGSLQPWVLPSQLLLIPDKIYLYNVGHKIKDIKMFLWRVLKDKRLKIRSFLADQSNVHRDERQRIFNVEGRPVEAGCKDL